MATAFTATTSTLIADTFSTRDAIRITNNGGGTLLVLIGKNTSDTPVASSTNFTYSIPSGGVYESAPGDVGRFYGIFLTAGTAYVTEVSNRLN